MKRLITTISILLLLVAPAANAYIIEYVDPANIHIGDPPNSGGYLYENKELRPISSTSLGIFYNPDNNKLFDNPFLLILGVPDQTALPPAISALSTGTASTPVFINKLQSGGEVYSLLGVGDGSNNSNSFTNWFAADKAVNGIEAQFFGIFTYALNSTKLASTGYNPLSVEFAADLPQGTFAIGYGETSQWTRKKIDGVWQDVKEVTSYTTPWTEAGLTTDGGDIIEIVPEPGTFVLLGIGLAGLGIYRRKQK